MAEINSRPVTSKLIYDKLLGNFYKNQAGGGIKFFLKLELLNLILCVKSIDRIFIRNH